MAWVIKITQRLQIKNNQGSIDRSYVKAIKRCGTSCSITTSFDSAKAYKNRRHFQKLLDFFEQSGIEYDLIPVEDKEN
jgi:hypothetical protein